VRTLRLPAALGALASQVAGLGAVLVAVRAGWLAPEPWPLAFAQGAAACAAAIALRTARWWWPVHLFFGPLVVGALRLGLPSWAYLAAFVALALVYGSSYRTQVPLFLTNRRTAAAVAALLPPRRLSILDIGSGTGAVLRPLARARPDCRLRGIESSWAPHWIACWRSRGMPNLAFERGDFFAAPWSQYDVVYAFLSPVPMPRVWAKAVAEMKPGSLLVSNSFPVPGIEPAQVVDVDDRRATRLYCYRPVAGRASS